MPELPEVETTRLGLLPYIVHQRVNSVEIRQSQLRWAVDSEIRDRLPGQVINALSRRGKYLIFESRIGCQLVHLGMSGALRLVDANQPWRKHDHLQWLFASGQALRFHDPRRFGAVLWATQPLQHKLLLKLGPEPLTDDFSAAYLQRRAKGRKVPVKTFIMNSQVVVGVGNIYASEALYQAELHPTRSADTLTLPQLKRLVTAIKNILAAAIQQGGTTLRDFVNGKGDPGYFQQQLQVYGRAGEPCHHCLQPLSMMKINQRSSVFCGHCQH
jgi:formamidopyrimidine-DNA glycosylase